MRKLSSLSSSRAKQSIRSNEKKEIRVCVVIRRNKCLFYLSRWFISPVSYSVQVLLALIDRGEGYGGEERHNEAEPAN